MLHSLTLGNMVIFSILENNILYHFPVVFSISKVGNFNASPFFPLQLSFLIFVDATIAVIFAQNFIIEERIMKLFWNKLFQYNAHY